MAEQLTLWTQRRTSGAYICPQCNGFTTLGVEFCPTHGWFPGWAAGTPRGPEGAAKTENGAAGTPRGTQP